MENKARVYNLFLTNSFPEKLFIKKFGQDLFDKLQNHAFIIDNGRCASCGHEPPEHKKKTHLFYHIFDINESEPELTKGVTLCKMCHLTQHVESAIKKDWVILVNSIYNQNNLIRLVRSGQIYGAMGQRAVVKLKKTPQDFLDEWKTGKKSITQTIKVVFNEKFVIDDLY